MAYPANKGKRCQSYKRVSSVYGGTVRRCSTYGLGRRRRSGYRRGHAPFNKGRKCLAKKKVYSPFFGKQVERCARFKNGAARASSSGGGVERNIYGGFAPGVPMPSRPATVPPPPAGRVSRPVTADSLFKIVPSYIRPRQLKLPGVTRRRKRTPKQAELPFQPGLSPEQLRTPPPPPPAPRKRGKRQPLTEHEKLMKALRKRPYRGL